MGGRKMRSYKEIHESCVHYREKTDKTPIDQQRSKKNQKRKNKRKTQKISRARNRR